MTGSVVHVVLTENFAGTERLVVTEAVELARRGWAVTVVGGSPARMAAELAGVPHRPAGDVVHGVAQLARVGRPDLVHAHLTAAEVAALAARPWTRAPVLATRHIAARRGSSRAGRWAAPVVRRGLAGQLAISRFVADAVGEPAAVVPNGVPVRAAGTPGPTVLVLQRLEREKATDVALRAWARSGLGGEGWRLVVAGAGGERDALRRLAAELGVTGSVDLLGWVDDPGTLLASAGALLAPAPGEPFGLTVAEAMAVGVPVVAADGGAHPEVLGEGGVLFPPGDAAAAGRALRELAHDAGRRRAVGALLRRRQQRRFTVAAHVDALEARYRRLLAGSGLSGR